MGAYLDKRGGDLIQSNLSNILGENEIVDDDFSREDNDGMLLPKSMVEDLNRCLVVDRREIGRRVLNSSTGLISRLVSCAPTYLWELGEWNNPWPITALAVALIEFEMRFRDASPPPRSNTGPKIKFKAQDMQITWTWDNYQSPRVLWSSIPEQILHHGEIVGPVD